MKTAAVLSAIVCTFAVMGLDSMSTDFTSPESAKGWTLDGSPAKMPALKFGYNAEKKAFVVDNKETKKVACFIRRGQFLDVKKGDVIHVSFEVCGQGKAYLTYECFNGSKWICMGNASEKFQLKPEWTKYEADLVVKDGKLPTTKVMMDFVVMGSANMMIRSYSAAKAAK